VTCDRCGRPTTFETVAGPRCPRCVNEIRRELVLGEDVERRWPTDEAEKAIRKEERALEEVHASIRPSQPGDPREDDGTHVYDVSFGPWDGDPFKPVGIVAAGPFNAPDSTRKVYRLRLDPMTGAETYEEVLFQQTAEPPATPPGARCDGTVDPIIAASAPVLMVPCEVCRNAFACGVANGCAACHGEGHVEGCGVAIPATLGSGFVCTRPRGHDPKTETRYHRHKRDDGNTVEWREYR